MIHFLIKSILLTSFIALLISWNQHELRGKASYYGHKFHGAKTSSGEKYDKNKYTAAHKTLAFGTRIEVLNVSNKKTTTVIVNDRGPFVKGRILDLSYVAAQEIDMIRTGTADIQITILSKPEKVKSNITSVNGKTIVAKGYSVQLAAFSDRGNAEKRAKEIEAKGFKDALIIQVTENKKTIYRVFSGNYTTKEEADKALKQLNKAGFKGFVKKLTP